jgi:hypothetical protein
MDGSVTISLRNFVGEGIKRGILMYTFNIYIYCMRRYLHGNCCHPPLISQFKHRQTSVTSNGCVDPICPLCGVGDEDIEHMLTRCSALHCIRKDQFTRFQELVISYIGTDAWSQTFNSMQSLVKLILDCKTFGYLFDSDTQLKNIMLQSMELCYKMHVHRVWQMKDYE